MSDIILIGNDRYLSTRDAGRASGFSRDYLARLCKRDKLRGRLIGKNWYIEESSLRRFLSEHGEEFKSIEEPARAEQILSHPAAIARLGTTRVAPVALHTHRAEEQRAQQSFRRAVVGSAIAGVVVLGVLVSSATPAIQYASQRSGSLAAAGSTGILDSIGGFVYHTLCPLFRDCPTTSSAPLAANSPAARPASASSGVAIAATSTASAQSVTNVYNNYPVTERTV